MKLQQIQNGHNHYRCIMSQELSLDPVYFIKHPIAEQRNAIYDRVEVTKALARRDAINACPQTRQVLAGDQLILESAKMEVLVWVLEAAAHLDVLTAAYEDQEIKADIERFIGEMQNKENVELLKAKAVLEKLKKNVEVSEISIFSIANLQSYGIEVNDFNFQRIKFEKRAEKQKEPEQKQREDELGARLAAEQHRLAEMQRQMDMQGRQFEEERARLAKEHARLEKERNRLHEERSLAERVNQARIEAERERQRQEAAQRAEQERRQEVERLHKRRIQEAEHLSAENRVIMERSIQTDIEWIRTNWYKHGMLITQDLTNHLNNIRGVYRYLHPGQEFDESQLFPAEDKSVHEQERQRREAKQQPPQPHLSAEEQEACRRKAAVARILLG
jgi:hypothetical protein